jgi:hypothetical protein
MQSAVEAFETSGEGRFPGSVLSADEEERGWNGACLLDLTREYCG